MTSDYLWRIWLRVELQFREGLFSPDIRTELGDLLFHLEQMPEQNELGQSLAYDREEAKRSIEQLFKCAAGSFRDFLAHRNYYKQELEHCDSLMRVLCGRTSSGDGSEQQKAKGNRGKYPLELLKRAAEMAMELKWREVSGRLLNDDSDEAGRRLSSACRNAGYIVNRPIGRPRKKGKK